MEKMDFDGFNEVRLYFYVASIKWHAEIMLNHWSNLSNIPNKVPFDLHLNWRPLMWGSTVHCQRLLILIIGCLMNI
jgi:hypothetical protein